MKKNGIADDVLFSDEVLGQAFIFYGTVQTRIWLQSPGTTRWVDKSLRVLWISVPDAEGFSWVAIEHLQPHRAFLKEDRRVERGSRSIRIKRRRARVRVHTSFGDYSGPWKDFTLEEFEADRVTSRLWLRNEAQEDRTFLTRG